MDKNAVKEIALSLGADLVGVAAIDRFVNSPMGHSPVDKFSACKSVIVMGCTFPQETLKRDTASYTAIRNGMIEKLDPMSEKLAAKLKNHKIKAKIIKSVGGRFVNGGFFGLISLKHAAELAGLGVIGRNYLLCIDSCPSSAIDGKGNIDQKACRRTCYIVTKGILDLKCWKCREVCPSRFGYKQ